MPNSQDRANAKLLTRVIFRGVTPEELRALRMTPGEHADRVAGNVSSTFSELVAIARVRNVSVGDLIKAAVGDLIKAAEERIAL